MRIGIFLIKTPSFSEKFLISKIENLQKLGHEVILFVNKKDDFSACKVVDMPKVSKALLIQVTKMLLTYLSILIRYPKVTFNFLRLEKQDGISFLL